MPRTSGTVKERATTSVTWSLATKGSPSPGVTEMTVPAGALDPSETVWMLWAPTSMSAWRASSSVRPTTSGITRSVATLSTMPAAGSARTPDTGSLARTVPGASSVTTPSTLTTKPSSSRALVASSCVMPTTTGTVLPPQSSCS